MIIVASTSLTRRSMLTNAGVAFTAVPSNVDERELVARNPSWKPNDIALHLAKAKAADVAQSHPDSVVIGADQALTLGNKVYSKPTDEEDCCNTLRELRGKTHQLISSVVCVRGEDLLWSTTQQANLTMRNFSDKFLTAYVRKIGADCTTTVGGYKIEGLGVQLFEKIEGDHFTILGMPLIPLLAFLRQAGEIER